MNEKSLFLEDNKTSQQKETLFNGIYGSYTITNADIIEVKKYRISVLICAMSMTLGIIHWITIGNHLAWIWLIAMCISLGLALNWIHIYLLNLHNALKFCWGLGCISIIIMSFNLGIDNILTNLAVKPYLTLAIGPLFVSLTGLGFKEFFCFKRAEAFGLTILLPIALLGHLSQLMNNYLVILFLSISSLLLLLLAIRKFGMDPASDIGDKSVFEYLENQRKEESA